MVDFTRKRLQVFVSSTFTDLAPERQAAVQAILAAGHIPAGMELFTSGDESQMDVIRQWIDESDVYLFILGGRYGSLEPKTKKSYTQLEYEYAVKKRKPLFACVIREEALKQRVRDQGVEVIERENHNQLVEFRQSVLSRTVGFWETPKDVRIVVGEALTEFSRRRELLGWIRPSDQFHTQVIPTRAELYHYCARLVQGSSQIRDTSWGRYPRPLDEVDAATRQEYRKAVDEALDSGKVYRELFSKSEHRSSLIADALEKKSQKDGYEAKLLDVDLSQLSILDFMIGDNSKVILSHVDARHEVPTFLYIESADLAQLFLHLFQELWVEAVELSPDNVV